MTKCSFCGNEIRKGIGLIYVKKDAKVFNFCSSKCERNLLNLKRKPRKIPWTQDYKKEKQSKK